MEPSLARIGRAAAFRELSRAAGLGCLLSTASCAVWGDLTVKQDIARTTTADLQAKPRGDDRNRTGVDGFAARGIQDI